MSRWGRHLGWPYVACGVVISLALLLLAGLWTTPRIELWAHGEYYAQLSIDPFGIYPGNVVHLRPLFPLVSHIFGLSGNKVVLTGLLFAWATLLV
jgi:hypothetical protein